jgi:hypothetical protein
MKSWFNAMGRPRAPAWLTFSAPAPVGDGLSCDGLPRNLEFLGNHGHGLFSPPKGSRFRWFRSLINAACNFLSTCKDLFWQRKQYRIPHQRIYELASRYNSERSLRWRSLAGGRENCNPIRIVTERPMTIKSTRVDAQQHLLDSHRLLLGSWGEQEELIEKSTRSKPLSASGDPGILLNNTMAGTSRAAGREDLASKLGKGRKQGHEANVKDRKNWAMEIYKGKAHEDGANLAKDEVLEFDLDEEEAEQVAKCLAIAIYYLRKSFSPQSLFSDMLAAWGIQNLNSLKKIGDYNFRLVFAKEEEKR